MKNKTPILFKKTSTCYGDKDLNIDYQNEMSEIKQDWRRQKYGKTQAELIEQNLKYQTKEELGQVHAGGFLYQKVAKASPAGSPAPTKLDNKTRMDLIQQEWINHLEEVGRPKKRGAPRKNYKGEPLSNEISGHKCVFSFDESFNKRLQAAGLNPDAVLQNCMKQTLFRFQDRFCDKGDSIGYSYGIHHDTDHLHVHVFLMPMTAKGKVIGLSQHLKSKVNSPSKQNDHIGFVKKQIEKEYERWDQIMLNPVARKKLLAQKGGERFFVSAPSPDHVKLSKLSVPSKTVREPAPAFDAKPHQSSHEFKHVSALKSRLFELRKQMRDARFSRVEKQAGHYVASLFGLKPDPIMKALGQASKLASKLAYELLKQDFIKTRTALQTEILKIHEQKEVKYVARKNKQSGKNTVLQANAVKEAGKLVRPFPLRRNK